VLFKFKALSPVYGSMAFDGQGNAYFGDKNGRIYSLDCAGRQRWIWASKSSYFNRPFVIGSEGTVYAAGEYLFAFDGRGTEKWTVTSEGAMNSSPAVTGGGVLYAGYVTNDGEPKDVTGGLLAFKPDGSRVDGFPLAVGGVFSSPAISSGILYLPSVDYAVTYKASSLWAVDASAGVSWRVDLDALGSSVALGSGGTVYVAENTKAMDVFAVLDAFDPSNGYRRWTFPLSGTLSKGVVGSPVVGSAASGEDVIVLTRDGHLISVNSLAGKATLVFNAELTKSEQSGAGSPLLGDDGFIYAAVAESLTQTRLFKVSPDGKSKTEIATMDGVKVSTALAIRGDGVIYFGSESGDVVAVKVDAAGLNKGAPWPSFRHDLRNTGNLDSK
jgi:outer membrane protein assembly factor BamB